MGYLRALITFCRRKFHFIYESTIYVYVLINTDNVDIWKQIFLNHSCGDIFRTMLSIGQELFVKQYQQSFVHNSLQIGTLFLGVVSEVVMFVVYRIFLFSLGQVLYDLDVIVCQ
eukprot:TRINITY_DN36358_c0_g1_i1.p6 TRINITY_DN36358_c0_g1~~TRINITY_DN36358_c0_g1_i1.p6  ORF type:complete len:114 (-),score=1.06 TRINITY_DN36358_c0_g1_i1:97-438(-)